jgi:hypothetical protein
MWRDRRQQEQEVLERTESESVGALRAPGRPTSGSVPGLDFIPGKDCRHPLSGCITLQCCDFMGSHECSTGVDFSRLMDALLDFFMKFDRPIFVTWGNC